MASQARQECRWLIAIIGILSSVVLASLNSARSKGADAAIESNLANTRAQAELVYDGANSYAGVCSNSTITAAVASAQSAAGTTGTRCYADANEWVIAVPLKTTSSVYACVDYKGAATSTNSKAGLATVTTLVDGNIDCD